MFWPTVGFWEFSTASPCFWLKILQPLPRWSITHQSSPCFCEKKTFTPSSVTEKLFKQESVLQEEINSSQGTDGETPRDEVEKAPNVTKAAQVEDSLFHYVSFSKLGLNALRNKLYKQ